MQVKLIVCQLLCRPSIAEHLVGTRQGVGLVSRQTRLVCVVLVFFKLGPLGLTIMVSFCFSLRLFL
jgi:hypothetical protein